MKLFILLPSYNEEEALPYLLKSMKVIMEERYKEYEIVIINDGSIDDTEKIAMEWSKLFNIKIISHERNKGLGEAVNTGLYYFYNTGSENDVVVIMDADNTHNPELIPLLLEKADCGSDVVIASRYRYEGAEIGLSFFRKLCSAAVSMILSLFFNIPGVKDYTCGYRMYKGSIIKKAYEVFGENFVEEKGFTCMAEVLIKLHYIGCQMSEIPLVLRYDLKKGRSKMKVLQTIMRYFVLISNIRRYRDCLTSAPALIDGEEK